MEIVSRAYQAEHLLGSYFTAPLRSYNNFFQEKIEQDEGYEPTMWKILYYVTVLFVYMTLGLLALIGVSYNLCHLPPEGGYSPWARLDGIESHVEKFCQDIAGSIHIHSLGISGSSSRSGWSTNRIYRFTQQKSLKFGMFHNKEIQENGSEEEKTTYNERIEEVIHQVQERVRNLAREYGWFPETYYYRHEGDKALLVIPVPDHIALNDVPMLEAPREVPQVD